LHTKQRVAREVAIDQNQPDGNSLSTITNPKSDESNQTGAAQAPQVWIQAGTCNGAPRVCPMPAVIEQPRRESDGRH
jgi:hypothetical protein